jgi:hypothetical protein
MRKKYLYPKEINGQQGDERANTGADYTSLKMRAFAESYQKNYY